MGTRVKVTYGGRSVVVEINDKGNGKLDKKTGANLDPGRVLDLSHAAYGSLVNRPVGSITDRNASVLSEVQIEVVPSDTPVGPVDPNR